MKLDDLQKLLMRCRQDFGNVEVHFLTDEDTESVECAEFDGDKIILGDLTRAQDNWANSEESDL